MTGEFQPLLDSLQKMYSGSSDAAEIWRQCEEAGYADILVGEPDPSQWGLAADVWQTAARQVTQTALPETLLVRWLAERAGRPRPRGACELKWGEPVQGQAVTCATLFVTDSACHLALPGRTPSAERVNIDGESPLAHAALMRAYQIAGALDQALELAIAHANEREQFGRPISSFQAVQHLLAHAAAEVLAARVAADAALARINGEGFTLAAAVAKARASEAAGVVSAAAHQVLGAIGFSHEHALHRFTTSVWRWRDEFGAEAHWYAWLERCVLRRPETLWASFTHFGDA